MSATTNPTDLLAWQEERTRLMRRGVLIGYLIAIVTYCGGITLSSFNSPDYHSWFVLGVWTPAIITTPLLLAWRLGWAKLMVPAHALPISLYLGCALQLYGLADKETAMVVILSNIPSFIVTSMVLFWPGRDALIGLACAVIFNTVVILGFTTPPYASSYNMFYLVLPIGLASIFLSEYRYNTTKKFFFITRDLNKKNQNITDSIRYAKRIQRAILPPASKIQEHLPESVIFYQPKDIVSGDFYWYHQAKDATYLAVVDCTGHGVPGAFMSLIGFNGLNMLVEEKQLDDPAEILTGLDRYVGSMLQQNQVDQSLRDGMDMILCRIDSAKREVQFSGAHLPLWVVRKGKLEEHKGARFPIGDQQIKNKTFSTSTISLEHGDTVYLSSDGFADQFGGPENKKYYKKRFKAYLEKLAATDIAQQESAIQHEFNSWLGDGPQMDDVTVAGFRLV